MYRMIVPIMMTPMSRSPLPVPRPRIRRRCCQFRIQQQALLILGIFVTNFGAVVLGFSSVDTGRPAVPSSRTHTRLASPLTTRLQSSETETKNAGDTDGGDDDDDDGMICAAVIVPGFLTGAAEFEPLCKALTDRGLPTVSIGMPNWHWLPCLGGRSARPILERIDFTVRHLIANDGDTTKIPPYEYTLVDTWRDFRDNPGGVFKVGGSSRVEDYPVVEPRGRFPLPDELPKKKVALIGHRQVESVLLFP